MNKQSAGLVVFRIHKRVEILLVHPGGPFFRNKDEGVWSIPKGEYRDREDPLQVAIREFAEETGNTITVNHFIELCQCKLKSGKIIKAWAIEENFEKPYISSNTFEIEWPPRSGRISSFDEVDKAEWFGIEEAINKINPAQISFINQLQTILSNKS